MPVSEYSAAVFTTKVPIETFSEVFFRREINLTYTLVALAAFFTLLVYGTMIYFCCKYRRGRPANRADPPIYNIKLEAAWSGVPLVLALATFGWSATLFFRLYEPPADAQPIYVLGKQWMWKIYHPDGPSEINELHLLKDQPVVLYLASQDVVHDFSVPAFKVKMDAVPGRYTRMWLLPKQTGSYWIFCAQYCGTDHSLMRGKVVVMDRPEYDSWFNAESTPPTNLVARGEETFKRLGCESCHSLYSEKRAPSLYNLDARSVLLDDGSTVQADENYLRESILHPAAQVVHGYPPVMPAFEGQVKEEELLGLLAYIKSLKAPEHRD